MADGKYMRLCSVWTCGGEHKAQGYCLRHYRQWQRGGVKEDATNCAHCGVLMDGRVAGSMYCSNRCKVAAWKAANPERCGILRRRERRPPPMPEEIKAQRKAVRAAAHAEARQKREAADKASMVERNGSRACLQCGAPCGYVFGRVRLFCSAECRRRSPVAKENKRAAKLKRKALTRGVMAESFSPLKVFERDGWRCQICGRSTPKSRRGTRHANAPELDHVVPLSKGGPHTMANTQCSCRSCNHAKSDRVVVGQRGLFVG